MQTVLTNARLILPEQVLHGTVVLEGGLIAEIQPGATWRASALDLDGDLLVPGAVDLHTDNLEREVQPRQNARWPSRAAMLSHDAHCAAAGITTVLDSLCVGDLGFDEGRQRTCAEGIDDLDALGPAGLLRVDHHLHLRCELPAHGVAELFARWAGHPRLRMVSLMDHTPGFGQYGDLDRYRAMRRGDGEAPEATERRIVTLQAQRARLRDTNRRALLALAAGGDAVLASHDDRTEADVAQNAADGIAVSEFPVTEAAARAARGAGMATVSGAPNLVRGGSHSGNVSAASLLRAELVDALASDYAPASLVHAAFLAAELPGWTLPRAVALVSDAPARLIGLRDRGRIAPGLRADLVRVRVHEDLPIIRATWCAGERV